MDFTAMDARAYMGLNADQYQERRSLVLDLAMNPGDATEEQIRSIMDEMDVIKSEDARRDKLTELRNHKAAEIVGGAGKVVTETSEKRVSVKKDNSLGGRTWEALKERGYSRDKLFQLCDIEMRTAGDAHTVAMLDGEASPNYFDYMLTEVDPTIREGYRRELTVWNLFNHEDTEKDTVTWFNEGTVEGGPGMTAELGAFSELTVNDPVSESTSLKKVTAIWHQSDEILTDAPRFVSHVNSRADYMLDIKCEDQLISGDGTGNNITGILNASGIGTATASAYDMSFVESLLARKTLIRKLTPHFNVDTLLVADEDYDALMILKNESGQYHLGGPIGVVYGSNVTFNDVLWRTIRLVSTPALSSGTSLLGAFKAGATVYEHVTGRRFDVGYDGTDFSHGRVTLRAYQRFGLAVEWPAAFCKYTVGTGNSSLSA